MVIWGGETGLDSDRSPTEPPTTPPPGPGGSSRPRRWRPGFPPRWRGRAGRWCLRRHLGRRRHPRPTAPPGSRPRTPGAAFPPRRSASGTGPSWPGPGTASWSGAAHRPARRATTRQRRPGAGDAGRPAGRPTFRPRTVGPGAGRADARPEPSRIGVDRHPAGDLRGFPRGRRGRPGPSGRRSTPSPGSGAHRRPAGVGLLWWRQPLRRRLDRIGRRCSRCPGPDYDPAADRWSALPPYPSGAAALADQPAVWTGQRLLALGDAKRHRGDRRHGNTTATGTGGRGNARATGRPSGGGGGIRPGHRPMAAGTGGPAEQPGVPHRDVDGTGDAGLGRDRRRRRVWPMGRDTARSPRWAPAQP